MRIKKTKVKTMAVYEPDFGLVDYSIRTSKVDNQLAEIRVLTGDSEVWTENKKDLLRLRCHGDGYSFTRYNPRYNSTEEFHLDFSEVTYLALILAEIDPENLTARIRRSFRVKKPKSKKP